MNKTGTIIITGGAQGIGRIIAEDSLASGYNVAVWDIDEEALQEERLKHEASGNQWVGITCDVSSEQEVQAAAELTLEHFGSINVLVNNAAIHANMAIEELTVEAWRRVIDINLTGAFICSKSCARELKRNRGSIINICSTRAFMSEAHTEAYSASKGGIYALTHAMAVSFGPLVRVNAISPGWIDVSAVRKRTKANQETLSEADHTQHPSGRVGQAGDISRMVLFLSDPSNDFITGQNFIIDGGMTRKMIYV